MDWRTPIEFYRKLDKEFGFDFDPCPVEPTFNGLGVRWGQCNFVNPPYGNEIAKWVLKGYEEAMRGKTVVMLVPSRTDTSWWHAYVMRADEIRFIRGRLHFDEHPSGAPFPSCVVIWKKELRALADRQEYEVPVEWEE